MRILEEFWYGNIEPTEYNTSSNKEYKKFARRISPTGGLFFIYSKSDLLFFHDFQHHPGTQLEAILEYQAICDGSILSYAIRVLLKQFFLLIRHAGTEFFFVPADQLH